MEKEREKERQIQLRKRERETGRKSERDTGERERQGERERDGEERENITKTKKFMEYYLVVLHSVLRSEARQVSRSCYNPLTCFNPATRFLAFCSLVFCPESGIRIPHITYKFYPNLRLKIV